MEKNVIHNIDCIELLKQLPDESIDFVITDFPYNISNYGNSLTKVGNEIVQGDFGEWDKWEDMQEYLDWVDLILLQFKRICKKNASMICFFDNRLAGYIAYGLEKRGLLKYKSPIIWEKNNPLCHVRKTGFRSAFEHAVWLINDDPKKEETIKSKTFNFLSQQEMCNVMSYNIGQKISDHPTEKPQFLIERMIKVFTNEGNVVLDCFMGSGTTAVACKRLGRDFIGCEINPEYLKMCKTRLNSVPEKLSRWF